MPVDPRPIVEEASARAAAPGAAAAPELLRHLPEPHPPLPPVQGGDEVAALHGHWADIHAAPDAGVDGAARATRVLARLGVPAPASGASQLEDRALIGEAIRALDAVARRVDELARRLAEVEAVVHEAVTVLGEDVVRALAATHPAGDPPRPPDGSGRRPGNPGAPGRSGHGVAE